MASWFTKILGGDDEDEYYEEQSYAAQPASQPVSSQNYQEQPQRRGNIFNLGGNRQQSNFEEQNYMQQPQMNSFQGANNQNAQTPMNVIRPKVFTDSKPIVASLLQDTPVIIDFSAIDDSQTNRAIDFISGALYAISGNLSKVRDGVYIATPRNYVVEGDITNNSVSTAPTAYEQRFSR